MVASSDRMNNKKYPHNKRFLLGRKHKILLFVGSLLPVKGLPLLVNAAERLKDKTTDFVLLIVGGGEERNVIKEVVEKK